MLIYLADLAHNYYPGLNTVPLNIAYVAAHAKRCFPDKPEIRLFKYADDILDAIDRKEPSLVGFSNYSWNESLNDFVGRRIKKRHPNMPIVMGGPNIRYDTAGIESFLKANDFVDSYITFEGEVPFTSLLQKILTRYPDGKFTGEDIRFFEVDSCFSLVSGRLSGRHADEDKNNLDYIPSPYLGGFLDDFLLPEFIPLFESNRGCPYACSYCAWGISARKRVKTFSLDRLRREMEYVAGKEITFDNWSLADANFGILPRDTKIARDIRAIYDRYRPFHTLTIWWDKNAKDHMIEIAKTLKGLSNAYIAFQTFDPYVEKTINRKNISIRRLLEISDSLQAVSERFHTDILLGLPGETMDSHLASLGKAFELGFDSIGGGEIRLLKGSELETDNLRKKYGVISKYRMVQEGFGVYKGQFVAEFEESIRSTRWITEDEMIELRVLRAIFFGAVTIGEFGPLMRYLKNSAVNIIDMLRKIIETKDRNPAVAGSVDWLFKKARNEWFSTKGEALNFFQDHDNKRELLQNPTIKLNYDFLSYLMMRPARYDAFYEFIHKILSEHFPLVDNVVASEILKLCRERNYILRCMRGYPETSASITLSDKAIEQLIKINYIPKGHKPPDKVFLSIDELVAKSIRDSLQAQGPKIQTVSLLTQKFSIYLTPR